MEWFQKTQMGLVRSSVSSSRNCTVTGLSRARGRSSSSSWTLMLTTGVLMMGRLGTLMGGRQVHDHHGWGTGAHPSHSKRTPNPGPALCLSTHPPNPLPRPTSPTPSLLTSGCACPDHSYGAAALPGCDR